MKQKNVIIYYGGFRFVYGGVNSHIKLIESELKEQGFKVSLITLDSLPILLKYLPHILEKTVNFINCFPPRKPILGSVIDFGPRDEKFNSMTFFIAFYYFSLAAIDGYFEGVFWFI